MKILIAYDGSACANAAIDDLSRAGLPDDTEALVITVTETWLPAKEDCYIRVESEEPDWVWRKKAKEEVAKCEKLAEEAARKMAEKFPSWQVD